MNIKRILTSVFATAIISATAITTAISASAYDYTYTDGYYYTCTANAPSSSTPVLDMGMRHRNSKVTTSGVNRSSSTQYIDSGVGAYLSSGKELTFNADGGYYGSIRGMSVSCSDCRSTTNGSFYYYHDTSLFGDITVSSSKIASIKKTVG